MGCLEVSFVAVVDVAIEIVFFNLLVFINSALAEVAILVSLSPNPAPSLN